MVWKALARCLVLGECWPVLASPPSPPDRPSTRGQVTASAKGRGGSPVASQVDTDAFPCRRGAEQSPPGSGHSAEAVPILMLTLSAPSLRPSGTREKWTFWFFFIQ